MANTLNLYRNGAVCLHRLVRPHLPCWSRSASAAISHTSRFRESQRVSRIRLRFLKSPLCLCTSIDRASHIRSISRRGMVSSLG